MAKSKGRYAKYTSVSVAKSMVDIQKVLKNYGANAFGFGCNTDKGSQYIEFMFHGTAIRIDMTIPKKEPEERQRWRAVLLVIKAKLESVESGISTLEQEFLAWIVMPGGRTLGDHILPKLEQITQSGKLPSLMAGES